MLTRRDFVRGGAVVAGAMAIGALPRITAQPTEGAQMSLRLGLASYTFRNFTRSQVIGFMKQVNVKDLNAKDVKDHLPSDPQQEAVALADYDGAGIKLHAAGAISLAKDEGADLRSKFEYCKRAGIRVIVAGEPSVEALPRIERFAKEYDIRIAIHNHGPEDKVWKSPLDVLRAVKGLDSRIGCCMDVGHAARAGTDVVQAIREIGPRLFNVHMKDLANIRDKDSQVAVGEGALPVRGIFEALIATRYEGFVDLEYEVHPDDPMPGVRSSFAYMRRTLADMGVSTRN